MKKAVYKNVVIFTGEHLCWSLFLMKFIKVYELYYKEIPTQVFFCEYCEIFKDNYYEEHLQTAASGSLIQNWSKGLCIGSISLFWN